MTDEDIEAIIDEAFYLRNTPWVKKICPKEHVVNNGALILVDYKNESYTLNKNKVFKGIAALIEQEELEDSLTVYRADEIFYCKDSTDKTKPKERASIHLITNELYDNVFLIDKMIQYGIFGKLVFE